MIVLATQTLPESSHSGYVAAAYIVFFVLVLVYVAIMAFRLTRVERSVRELRAREREGDSGRERSKEKETV
jgi:flagellar biosynthesis/type III secretory pathway M-ring protein FliF/YscJ